SVPSAWIFACVSLILSFLVSSSTLFFFFNDTATTEIYTLSLTTLFRSSVFNRPRWQARIECGERMTQPSFEDDVPVVRIGSLGIDRKSTRLNSSHVAISYAVFCLKKKIMFDLVSSRLEPIYDT